MALLIYKGTLGPVTVSFGAAGSFTAGEPKETDDALADQLMAKGCFDRATQIKPAKPAELKAEG